MWKIRDWFCIPDVQIGWIPFALPVAIRTIRRKKIDVIWTKCPPYSLLVLGALIKRLTGVRWVIDLADPWTTASYTYFPNATIKKVNEWLEKRIFNYADRIVTVTENIVDDYKIKYPKMNFDKFMVIPNGYDVDDHKVVEPAETNKFTICYTGRIDLAGRDPRNFIDAYQQFVEENSEARENSQILFVGGGGEYWQNMVAENEMHGRVVFTGNVSHEKCLAYQAASDVLLLIGGGSKYEQTGKIFEYLVADKPILSLIRPDAPASQIVKETNTGTVISNDDIQAIKSAIEQFYNSYRNKQPLWRGRNKEAVSYTHLRAHET